MDASEGMALNAQIHDMLGDARFGIYERTREPEYIRLRTFAQDKQIPLDEMAEVYEDLRSTGHQSDGESTRIALTGRFGDEIGQEWEHLMTRGKMLANLSSDPAPSP